jgi:transporter family-2 protein
MPTIVIVILFTLLGGIAVGLQGPLSSMITEQIGVMESIFIVHISGAVLIGIPLLLHRGGNLGQWRHLPWYALLSGASGLVIIAALSFAIPRVGVAPTVTLVVAGQLILSLLVDHFGLLGTDVRHVDLTRLLGVIVLFVGVWLIVHE